jgi:hypothetical protein
MQDLRSIGTNDLLDMLSTYTAEYLKLSAVPSSETDYAKCYLTLRAIQSEIEARKQSAANTNTTDPTIIIQ